MTTKSDSQSQKVLDNSQIHGNFNVEGNVSQEQTINISLVNSSGQDETSAQCPLSKYRSKSEKFIYKSCVRCGGIDIKCEELLEEVRKNLGLLPKQTMPIEKEIVNNYCDAERKLEDKVNRHQCKVVNVIQDKSLISDAYREDLKDIQEAIEIKDQHAAPSFILLGNEIINKGELKQANACFHEAIRLNDKEPSAYVSIGTVLYKQGYVKEALDVLKKAERLYQRHPKLGKDHKELKDTINYISKERKWQNIFISIAAVTGIIKWEKFEP